MGTTISIELIDVDHLLGRSLVEQVAAWFHHVDAEFSPYKETSTITGIGRGELELDDPRVDDDVRAVLQRCGELTIETDGVFDVWSLPSPNGTRFDPCGYVKGWSVQRAADHLRSAGVEHFCINAGGDIAVAGRDAEGGTWRIGVRHPDDASAIALVVELPADTPYAIATSGSYERGAHIVDPRDGLATTELASVTVIGPDLAEADAYATTIYVMGVDGLAWLAGRSGYSGCIITRDQQLLSTDDFDRHLVM